MSIRVLLADDHRIVREGLRALLEGQQDIEVVAEAEDGLTMLRLVKETAPDVAVVDVAMPDLNGIEATRQLIARAPGNGTRVIALSMYSDRRFVAGMLGAGASGYLLKDCAFEELARAIRAVAANQTYLSPSIAGVVVKSYLHKLDENGSSAFSILTGRQRQVLQLLAEGKNTKEIANRLGLSVKTVETHRQRIMDRLDVHSIAELTRYAISEGLTPLES
jgi:two-component system response regulator NreC